jgi:hypothetical protein
MVGMENSVVTITVEFCFPTNGGRGLLLFPGFDTEMPQISEAFLELQDGSSRTVTAFITQLLSCGEPQPFRYQINLWGVAAEEVPVGTRVSISGP